MNKKKFLITKMKKFKMELENSNNVGKLQND